MDAGLRLFVGTVLTLSVVGPAMVIFAEEPKDRRCTRENPDKDAVAIQMRHQETCNVQCKDYPPELVEGTENEYRPGQRVCFKAEICTKTHTEIWTNYPECPGAERIGCGETGMEICFYNEYYFSTNDY
jgi:hypothetical protein